MLASDLLSLTPFGLYCSAGDFYIDPLRAVSRALVTHAHSDHARPGHGVVLATGATLALMALRYGSDFAGTTQAVAYGERLRLGDVAVSFHPAGHVLGSAQIVLTFRGRRIVVSGDYKRQADPTCAPYEPLACDCFITEATFGLPVFRHGEPVAEINKLLTSLQLFPERPHVVGAYALGKAQRIIALLRAAGYDRPIFLHGGLVGITDYYQSGGLAFGPLRRLNANEIDKLGGAIILCPPIALESLAARSNSEPRKVFASGWMRIRARARQRGIELPLVISDHADWDGLCRSIVETGCSELLVTHGESDALVHWAKTHGIAAAPLPVLGYGDEDTDAGSEASA